MTTRRAVVVSLGAGGMAWATPTLLSAAARPSLNGTWSGYMDSDDPPTRLRLRLGPGGQGSLTVISTVDELSVPLTTLETSGRHLRLEVAQPPLSYEAHLETNDTLRGTLVRGQSRLPLTFVRGDLYSESRFEPAAPERLSAKVLHRLRFAARAPAMGVGWQVAGHVDRVLVDGYRNAARRETVLPTDVWHIGSVTKSVTATLAARLVELGNIKWTSGVGDLLDAVAGPIPDAYREVTLLHLLSHRGGLPRDIPDDLLRRDPDMSASRYVALALEQAPAARIGAETLYSNVDYVVAGLMLEVAAGSPFQTLMQKHLFSSLGIADAVFTGAGDQEGTRTLIGHSPGPTGIVPDKRDVPACMTAAGRIRMSLGSLVAYLRAHRDMPTDFLSARSWSILHTAPFGGDYALGWNVSPDGVLSHGGTNQRWKCEVRVNPRSGVVSCSAANVLNRNTQLALLQLLNCADASS